MSGFDGTLEETYLQVGVAGLQRGLVVGPDLAHLILVGELVRVFAGL